ncbi:hypothetical protein C8R45DRAFT_1095893 [Mycena sanguinolenta]|nr:hypothetical protein C8R45DRAFT_1095893 [Mycena sanguinolenta]
MPIISIFGATGSQGSAVLEAVLADGKYTPCAVSRSLDSDASKALIARGVEVVVGNLWDTESLKKAIRGSEAVFGDPEVFPADPAGKGEITQGKNLVDAAKAEGVILYLEVPITEESKGLYKHVYHCDSVRRPICGWFIDNLWKRGSLQKTDTGYIPIPKFAPEDGQAATWVAHDVGPAALGMLKHYADPSKKVLGSSYPVISFKFTYPELAAETTFVPVATAGMEEIDEMFTFQAKNELYHETPSRIPILSR